MVSTAKTQAGQVHPPIQKLRQALSFRVARLAALNERAGSFHFQAAFNLRLNEWRVLGLTVPEGKILFSELREILWIDKGQLSRVVKSLVDAGLIETSAAQKDARQLELTATEKGKRVHDEALRFTQGRNEAVVETLTPEECATFLRILDKILSHNEELAHKRGHFK